LTYEWAFYIWFALTFSMLRIGGRVLAAPMILLGVACLLHWPITAFFCIGMLLSATGWRISIPGPLGLMAGLACGIAMYASLVLFHPFVGLIPGLLLFAMVLGAGFVVAGPDLSVGGERPRGWELDRMPYHLETSVPGVFVAGDARSESAKRVASAVGEGALAVMLVHRYLEKR